MSLMIDVVFDISLRMSTFLWDGDGEVKKNTFLFSIDSDLIKYIKTHSD